MAMEERIDAAARDTIDRTQDALSSAGKSLKSGYDAAQKYAQNSDLGSQLGDFVVRDMGEDNVIVSRDRQVEIHVFLNVCSHRGMKVCRAEAGNAEINRCISSSAIICSAW